MSNARMTAKGPSYAIALAVCYGCSQTSLESSLDEVELLPDTHSSVAAESEVVTEVEPAQRSVDPDRRARLSTTLATRVAEARVARRGATGDNGESAASPNESMAASEPMAPSEPVAEPETDGASDEASAGVAPSEDNDLDGITSGSASSNDETLDALWEEFVSSVQETATGSFMVGDIALPDEESLVEYFLTYYAEHVDKGLVIPAKAWPWTGCGPNCIPPPIELKLCWTQDSPASTTDKAFVETLVNNTWPAAGITFNFKDSGGNYRTCGEQQCGFFRCPTGDEDIHIFQTPSMPTPGGVGGCTTVLGSDLASAPGGNCDGVIHDYAGMMLPTGTNGARAIIHEFGHAIALMHEHLRMPPAGACAPIIDDQNNWLPVLPNLGGCTGAGCWYEDVSVGVYDPLSIMHYCTDGVAQLTLGDIAAAQALYGGREVPVKILHSSWRAATVNIAMAPNNWNVSATSTKTLFVPGTELQTIATYSIGAAALGEPRLRCSATKPTPTLVRDTDAPFQRPEAFVPPGGFEYTPITVTCYDPAAAFVAL